MSPKCVIIQIQTSKQFFYVQLFILLCNSFNLKSGWTDPQIVHDYLKKSYRAALNFSHHY